MNDIKMLSQQLLIGIPSKDRIKDTLEYIKKYSVGGVLLYKACYNNLDELKNLINALYDANKDNNVPLFIALDQEGGRVNRLPKEIKNIPSAYKMSKLSFDKIYTTYYNLSNLLHDIGINMNLAPVLDKKLFDDHHAIGDRAYSNDINRISQITDIIIKAHVDNNVIPVIKHFPGQGSLKKDSHVFLPILKKYPNEDVIPFKKAIDNNVDALLVGHIIIKGYTGLCPASISNEFINNEIRNNLKYSNLIVTDELCMKSVRLLFGKRRSIKKAFLSGADLICLKYSVKDIEKILCKLSPINNVDSYKRIINIKKKFNINDKSFIDKIDINKYNEYINEIRKEAN